jgi:hypothetical protein
VRITPDILVAGEKGGLLDILLAQFVRKGTLASRAEVLGLAGSPEQSAATAEMVGLASTASGKR